jgi:hypothetical protein
MSIKTMMKLQQLTGLVLVLFFATSCEQPNPNYKEEINDAAYFHQAMKSLTDVIVHDIFSPPAASRVYVYPSIAAYEAIQHDYPAYQSLAGQLNGLTAVPMPAEGQEYCLTLSALHAFLEVGKTLIHSEDTIIAYQQGLYEELGTINMPKKVWERSIAYGDVVADHILAWLDTDNYKQTRTHPKFSIQNLPERWQPTPPAYMDGIEPHWREIRTMVMDSAEQFKPLPPTPFSTSPESQFMKETMEVYEVLKIEDEQEKEERVAIASFWDCNPYVSHQTGHVMYATKKITPGGHWIGITQIACEQAEAGFMKTVEAYTITSIALFDAFISCWDEKYRSNLVRPETVINEHIDDDWLPALQTPPFPEHTSGHSVISRAAAVALTAIFGDSFKFVDTTEEEYGLPARTFNSFLHASEEAAISRLYGGIHYRPAIDYGVAQGEKVGELIVSRIQTKAQLGGLEQE